VVVVLHFAAELTRGVSDDVLLLEIASALNPVLNKEPGEELDSWRGSVPQMKSAKSQLGGGGATAS
jgi:hypothetical protein